MREDKYREQRVAKALLHLSDKYTRTPLTIGIKPDGSGSMAISWGAASFKPSEDLMKYTAEFKDLDDLIVQMEKLENLYWEFMFSEKPYGGEA